jgi:hypothetical protein
MCEKLFWVTFRIGETGNALARRTALEDAISDCAKGRWWREPTSFILFRSDLGIDRVSTRLKRALDLNKDLAVIGMPDIRNAHVIGKVKDADLFDLWDWVAAA